MAVYFDKQVKNTIGLFRDVGSQKMSHFPHFHCTFNHNTLVNREKREMLTCRLYSF